MIIKSQKAKVKIIAGQKKPLKLALNITAHKFNQNWKKLIVEAGRKIIFA